jgi:tetratricopeptide (TPR) repeat protein
MGMSRGMNVPRSFASPGMARGNGGIGGAGAGMRPGSFAAGRGPAMAGGPGFGNRGSIGSMAGIGRNAYGIGGRAPIGSTGSLAAHNPYSLGARAPIGTASRIGGLGGAGRAGVGINSTSLNRAGFSNRSIAVNRTSNTFNNFNNTRNAVFAGNRFGNNSFAGLHQGWLHGRWGGGGFGRRGFGGFGPGFGFFPGFGFGGFGLGLGLGLGFGLGNGLFGLGYGLGGWGYGGWGYGGFGNWGFGGLGFGGLGYGYGGYGLSSWTYGPSLYDWGYASYYNPYSYGSVWPSTYVASLGYDYTQPINTQAAPPDPALTSQAITYFDAAREAFKAGNYTRALELTDQAIRQMPNDAALHEFRALALFALHRYDESASALYAVLSAGPGWDWATLSGLYPSVSVYTQQLRALEAYCGQNPSSASARFVLAYHYLTDGHTLAALQQLKEVAALQPKDGLSPQLARQLEPSAAGTSPGPASGPSAAGPAAGALAPAPPLRETSATAPAAPGREGRLEGTWTAQADKDTAISLTFPDPSHFTWTVTQQGQTRQLQGKLTYGNGILTLAQDQGPAIVGNTTWTDETHFTFKVPGAGPNDSGLMFTKQ